MTPTTNAVDARLWVIIPAAGSGRRIPGDEPKQYARVAGRSVLEWSIEPFLRRDDVAGIIVAIAAADERWDQLELATHRLIRTVPGGAERAQSVQHALQALQGFAHAQDWVLVHDAARPCLDANDLELLIKALATDAVGGLLATPLTDTVKHSDDENCVIRTVCRERLWRALTPQMFRYGALTEALARARASGQSVTDEASAMEMAGLRPRLIGGRPDNIKITLPADLELAERILAGRNRA